MMRFAAVLLTLGLIFGVSGFAVAAIGEAISGAPVTVAIGKTISLAIPGATAAYSLNSSVADASAENGVVHVRGIGGGSTGIVVVTASATTTVVVTVPAAHTTTALPPDGSSGTQQGGYVESSYNSNAGQLSTSIQLQKREGERYRRFWLVTQTFISPANGRGTGFPLLSYEIGAKGRSVTLLDKAVSVSPLTLSDSLIRGIHATDGAWNVHAGASSVAQFGQYLIPADPQWVFGATRVFRLSATSSLDANLYDIVNSRGSISTPGGALGSMAYTFAPNPRFNALAEVGLSRSVGLDAEAHYADESQTMDASILERPPNFAALATNAQQGFFTNAAYSRVVNPRLGTAAALQQSNYRFGNTAQKAQSAQANVSYALTEHVSIDAGAQYSALGARSLSLPLAVQVHERHVSAGLEYQPASNLAGTFAGGYGVHAALTNDRFVASAFYRHDVDIPTVSAVFGQVPGLQAALDASGISVNSPADLEALLGNAALLSKLGFSNLSLDLAPARNDVGVNAIWSSQHQTQHVTLSYLSSNAKLLSGGGFGFRIASLAYSMQMGGGDELSASAALLDRTPSFGVTLRRRLQSVPDALFPAKRGAIDGYVFEDDELTGAYGSQSRTLSGVVVTLDGDRTIRTDGRGHYVFTGVPYGEHHIQAALPQGGYFTTDSPAAVQIGGTVNIGVSFVHGRLFGTVTNDAGAPIPGAVVSVAELGKNVNVDDGGAFAISGISAGTYTLRIASDSLPPGYDLSTLKPVLVRVDTEAPASADFVVPALRGISGTVTLYDPRKGVVQPAPGMEVSIPQLGLTCMTNESGEYAFRNLPAGTFLVEIDGGSNAERRTVTLSAQPETLTNLDYRVTQDQALQRRRAVRRQRS